MTAVLASLLWALVAYSPEGIGQEVARYNTASACETGRIEYSMSHVEPTECAYNPTWRSPR